MSMTWGQLSGLLARNSIEKHIPIIGEFELTPRCNLKCRMCYIRRNYNDSEAINGERTAKEWIQLACEARDAGMLFLLLTGGEVFLRKDFKTIYEEISMMGFNITIYTNGTMITPQAANWLGNIPPSQIEVTLYGSSPDTYGRVCGDPDGFERAVRGIGLLADQGINVQLRTTVVRGNADDFETIADMAKSLGLSLGIVNYISPRREGTLNCPEAERLSPKELAEFEKRVSRYNGKQDNGNKYPANPIEDKLAEVLKVPGILPGRKNSFPCGNGKNVFWITWDGRMVPCSLMDKPETFPFEYGFMPAWQELQKLCTFVPACEACSRCSFLDYCASCPARLLNETGSFEQPALYLCELAQEREKINQDKVIYADGR